MQGKIIKGIAGKYYVDCHDGRVYTCTARGIFRNDNITPVVGDDVIIDVNDEEHLSANITEICERRNILIRPACANIDQALVVFAAASPEPNYSLLDRFLIMMKKQNVPVTVCFNKTDIAKDKGIELLKKTYSLCGHDVLFISVRADEGIEEVIGHLRNKTTVLAGPSGVGKSSLMNRLAPFAHMETGELSRKIERGKQTTRHTELIKLEENTYLCDTPGFSSLYVTEIKSDELKTYFPEFEEPSCNCRFLDCRHLKEPDCAVRDAVGSGIISSIRYDDYVSLYQELVLQEKRNN